ncbi:MAG: DUF3027 domain-containing protein [Actinomycetota bacterium]|nr:DUF3027 domain-containing protein [Actinomycetota bacterium]
MNTSGTSTAIKSDPVLIGAEDFARAAVVDEVGADFVGEHLGAQMDAERIATHLFVCSNPAYLGWNWAVVLVRAARGKVATVNDVVLMPGANALVAPAWVPWSERVQAGDLGVGDILPTPADDPRLVAGLTGEDELEGVASLAPLNPGQWELGLGRVRVLSPIGRDEATLRWHEGDTGPQSAMARNAALECGTCGFLLVMGGVVGQAFGICANELGAADGKVVSMSFGCGAHSEVLVEPPVEHAALAQPDETGDLGHS